MRTSTFHPGTTTANKGRRGRQSMRQAASATSHVQPGENAISNPLPEPRVQIWPSGGKRADPGPATTLAQRQISRRSSLLRARCTVPQLRTIDAGLRPSINLSQCLQRKRDKGKGFSLAWYSLYKVELSTWHGNLSGCARLSSCVHLGYTPVSPI